MWESGRIEKYEYKIRVFEMPSNFGIEGGRISNLTLIDTETGEEVVDYDRGWGGLEPKNAEQTRIVKMIVAKYS
ncbi:DUF7678 domain-containing protein [Enterococcus sp. LJL128]